MRNHEVDGFNRYGNLRKGLNVFVAATAAVLALSACTSDGNEANSARREMTSTTAGPVKTPTSSAETTSDTACNMRPAVNPAYDVAEDAVWTAKQDNDFQKAAELLTQINDLEVRSTADHGIQVATAEAAAWTAIQDDDFVVAEALVDTITDQGVKASAERAVDLAQAQTAAWEALHYNNFTAANSVLELVEDPEILSLGRDAVSIARREDELWKQNPRNISAWAEADTQSKSTWADLDRQVTGAWADLDRQSTGEWASIFEQSSDYCPPAE